MILDFFWFIRLLLTVTLASCQCHSPCAGCELEQSVCPYEDSVQLIKDDVPGEVLAKIGIKHVKSLKQENVNDRDFIFKYDKKLGSAFPRSPVNDLFASPVLALSISDPSKL